MNCLDLKSKWPFALILCLFLPWVGVLRHDMSAKPFREMITHHCQLKCYFWWPFSNFQFLTIHKLNMSGGEEWLKTLHWHEQVMYTSPVHVRGSKCKYIGRPLSYPQIQYVCIHYGHSFRYCTHLLPWNETSNQKARPWTVPEVCNVKCSGISILQNEKYHTSQN